MTAFAPGQRWISAAEPELGLGTVMRLAGRSVQIVFTATGVVRQYAIDGAPLARAAFRVGDRVRVDGVELVVEAVEPRAGVLHYRCGGQELAEGALDAEQPVSQADRRLLAGRVDRNDQFEFRLECLERRAQARRHPGWGVLGARIELIPHQLRVAELAASRRPPRLLLADEVGLGKTVEACLILAQQLASGRVARVLVLVPESLCHQWLVELLRRFNLAFAIFDEERCEAFESAGSSANPFEDEQLAIAAVGWLAHDARRRAQAVAAGWDLLVVDEAHHLGWTPQAASPEYALVEALAARAPALVLLTATPEQLGRSGHFARLRLLDPARYTDLEHFLDESAHYVEVSAAVDALLAGQDPDAAACEQLARLFGDEAAQVPVRIGAIASAHGEDRQHLVQALIDDLVDRHGTGRVMLRHRRDQVGGFPQRRAEIATLPASSDDPGLLGRLRAELLADVDAPEHCEPEHDYAHDPRLDWLLATLEAIAPAKALLLCRSRAKVQALEEALRLRSGLAVARFHEQMNLLQRDRNAAYFADPAGARLLIASEIGAEGRNFQFAQHLILWDLPLDPDLLEQRIGRLDRIGQRGEVHIHAAAVEGSAQELLLRWYAEGLDALVAVCADGRELLREFGPELIALARDDAPGGAREPALAELIARTRARHAELSARIHQGRDRLLELAGARVASGRLPAALAEEDARARDDDYPLRLLEQFGVHAEPLSADIVLLDPEYLTHDAFEAFKSGPRPATFDRASALARDDLLYLRADHPLLLSAQELLLSTETGNAAFLLDDALPPKSLLLEAVFVLECVAETRLDAARFLPPEPLRCVIDTRLAARDEFTPSARARQRAGERSLDLTRLRKPLAKLLPPMLERAHALAAQAAATRAERAGAEAEALLGHELERLQALAAINPAVRPQEVEALRAERDALRAALPRTRPRLDALRVIASLDVLRLAG